MDSLSLHLISYHWEGIRVASMRIHVKCLCHIRLNIDKHLSLGLLLLHFKLSLLLQDTPASLVKLLIIRLRAIFEIIFILVIIDFNPSLVAFPDVMQLQLTWYHLRNHVSQLIGVVQEVRMLTWECLGLAYFGLVVIADDYRDDQRLRLLLGRLLDYDLWLLDDLGLLVDWVWLLWDLILAEIVCLETHIKHWDLGLRLLWLLRHHKFNRLLAASKVSLISELIKYPLDFL